MTRTQLKEKFLREGLTFAQWAREKGFDKNIVYLVVNGHCKARYGKGHEVAVALGLKPNHSQGQQP
ncbi:MAG: DNA-binding protein [Azoarcus sp.]|jgi:gp16 family phage-associated protein|nr:DNA-binding protein [Azoarcus sp.]